MAPVYEYACDCGQFFDRYLPLARYDEVQKCLCGRACRKLLPRVTVISSRDIHYESPIDGRPVTSEAARRQDLARSGSIPYDPEMKKDAERRRQDEDKAMDAAIDATVEREIAAMPSAKRERLEAELTRSDTDLAYTRGTAS